jgi:hypothetical protein
MQTTLLQASIIIAFVVAVGFMIATAALSDNEMRNQKAFFTCVDKKLPIETCVEMFGETK